MKVILDYFYATKLVPPKDPGFFKSPKCQKFPLQALFNFVVLAPALDMSGTG